MGNCYNRSASALIVMRTHHVKSLYTCYVALTVLIFLAYRILASETLVRAIPFLRVFQKLRG